MDTIFLLTGVLLASAVLAFLFTPPPRREKTRPEITIPAADQEAGFVGLDFARPTARVQQAEQIDIDLGRKVTGRNGISQLLARVIGESRSGKSYRLRVFHPHRRGKYVFRRKSEISFL